MKLFCFYIVAYIQAFNLHFASDPKALCLDGSPASYYKAEGYGTGAKQYILHFQGGARIDGSTQDQLIQSAYLRSKTQLGSSKDLNKQMLFNGMFSRSQNKNPYYYNWNLIHFNYCDGSLHQGYKSDPIEYLGTQLYFRGDVIVKSFISDLFQELSTADTVIVSGCSAGGNAAYFWIEYIRALLPQNVTVYGVPDSGMALNLLAIDGTDYPTESLIQLIDLVNIEVTHPNKQCVEKYSKESWKCYYAQYLFEFIKTPLFIIQSMYDYFSLTVRFKIDCAKNYTLTNCSKEELDFAQNLYKQNYEILSQRKKDYPETGAFAPSCLEHCFLLRDYYDSSDWEVPGDSGNTIQVALNNWLNSKTNPEDNFYVDKVEWPDNKKCSNSDYNNYSPLYVLSILLISHII
ncbi:unnamed protein product [Paramecium pentaurelia]|uniref:Pectinacetylesterase family protein n=1 Tax=Paramecium pentaurelia TaxID=43138 RepID=A0A8S1TZ10_9CILI|nr:unnamed protein product [Paramecium pentaurelia]